MSKLYILILSLSIAFMGNAQNTIFSNQSAKDHEIIQDINTIDNTVVKNLKIQYTKGSANAWFHQPAAVSDQTGKALSQFKSINMTLFKDTSVMINYTDGLAPIWYLAAGNVTDPTGYMFDYKETNDEFNANSTFTFDSIGFRGLYIRHSPSNIIDTLVIQIQENTYYFRPSQYGPNSNDSLIGLPVIFHNLHTWETTSSTPKVKSVKTIKIPLDTTFASKDTTINGQLRYYYKYFEFSSNMPTKLWNTRKLPRVVISFISGSTYTPNVDTIIGATNPFLNSFRIRAFKYADKKAQSFFARDKSCSYVFTRQGAQTTNTSTYFYPSYFFNAKFSYEYFDVFMKYSTNNVSIDASNNSNISVAQNHPNPFSGTTSVNYSLSKSAKVNIAVFTIAGSKVMQIEEGLKSAGKHNVEINASNLPAGIYFYTFTADNYSVTKKMIVF